MDLNRLKKQQIIDVMYSALDRMQQYNGRSKSECIDMALKSERFKKQNDK